MKITAFWVLLLVESCGLVFGQGQSVPKFNGPWRTADSHYPSERQPVPPPPKFLAPPFISTDPFPMAVAIADLNHDGHPDWIVGARGYVDVVLNKGDGSVVYRQYSLQEENAFGIAIADMNNDGIPDILTVTHSNIIIMLGKGDGTFNAGKDFPGGGSALAVGDFNGDGKVDVVVTLEKSIAMYLGNGDGTLQAGIGQRIGNVDPRSVVVGDFNGDGKLDAAIAGTAVGGAGLAILYGNGDGTLQSPKLFLDSNATQVFAADVNSDGLLDLVTLDSGGIGTLLNQGSGKFALVHSSSQGLSGSFTVGDFNNDGNPDVAIAGLGIFTGKGDGTFNAPTAFYADGGDYPIVAADFNGDHKLDIAQILYPGLLQVFFGNGDGTLVEPRAFQTNGDQLSNIATGDLNNDGTTDVVILNGGNTGIGTVTSLLGNGDGTFSQPIGLIQTTGGVAYDMASADFNGDGILDVAVLNSTSFNVGVVNMLFGKGDGTFLPPSTFNVESGRTADRMITADFNSDGIPDLAVLNVYGNSETKYGTLGIMLGHGDGTFQQGAIYYGSSLTDILAADFNNDGILDVAIASGSAIQILTGNGDGTFVPGTLIHTNNAPAGFLATDLNLDGNEDLVVLVSYNVLSVFLGNGKGRFGPPLNNLTVSSFNDPIAADINGDGLPDIILSSAQVLLGNGDGTLQPPVSLGPDAGGLPRALTFDNDVLPDLLFGSGLPAITVFVNLGK